MYAPSVKSIRRKIGTKERETNKMIKSTMIIDDTERIIFRLEWKFCGINDLMNDMCEY